MKKKKKKELKINSKPELNYKNKKYYGWGVYLWVLAIAIIVILPIALLIAYR